MEEERDSERQLARMTGTPVSRLVGSLAAPAIAGMLVSAAYNLVDAYYVGRVGTSASAAVGVVFSLEAFIQALGYTLGMGAAGQLSQLLGRKKNREADTVLSTAVFSAVGAGAAVAACGLLFLEPLMRFLGAIPSVLPYAKAYAGYLLPGAPVICASFVLNCGLRAEGRAKFAMAGVLCGCLMNVALAPLFLFTLRMGVAGAGLASALSQAFSFAVLLSCYLKGKTIAKIRLKSFSFRGRVQAGIWKTGAPSFIHQGLNSVDRSECRHVRFRRRGAGGHVDRQPVVLFYSGGSHRFWAGLSARGGIQLRCETVRPRVQGLPVLCFCRGSRDADPVRRGIFVCAADRCAVPPGRRPCNRRWNPGAPRSVRDGAAPDVCGSFEHDVPVHRPDQTRFPDRRHAAGNMLSADGPDPAAFPWIPWSAARPVRSGYSVFSALPAGRAAVSAAAEKECPYRRAALRRQNRESPKLVMRNSPSSFPSEYDMI